MKATAFTPAALSLAQHSKSRMAYDAKQIAKASGSLTLAGAPEGPEHFVVLKLQHYLAKAGIKLNLAPRA